MGLKQIILSATLLSGLVGCADCESERLNVKKTAPDVYQVNIYDSDGKLKVQVNDINGCDKILLLSEDGAYRNICKG